MQSQALDALPDIKADQAELEAQIVNLQAAARQTRCESQLILRRPHVLTATAAPPTL